MLLDFFNIDLSLHSIDAQENGHVIDHVVFSQPYAKHTLPKLFYTS